MKKPKIVVLPPNRTRRNYSGGKLLDKMQDINVPRDGNQPEDWVASTVVARNPGLPEKVNEGLSHVDLNGGISFKDLLMQDPGYYLGDEDKSELGFLVKILDSSMRLHVQAHPTSKFARKYLSSCYGKLEFYYILETRDGVVPTFRLGFQHPPDEEEFLRVVKQQDIDAMDGWFEEIKVTEGEAWIVPGAVPHAIGAGVLLVEIMEPSDLVVRLEFEREGIIVPPPARFMGKNPEFAALMIDFSEATKDIAREKYQISPIIVETSQSYIIEEYNIKKYTDAFIVQKITVKRGDEIFFPLKPMVCIGLEGRSSILDGENSRDVLKGTRFFKPAAVPTISFKQGVDDEFTFLCCFPSNSDIKHL